MSNYASVEEESSSDEDISKFDELRVCESEGSDGSLEHSETSGNTLGSGGYLFEPMASDHSDDESEEDVEPLMSPQSERVGNTNWCSCGQCRSMGTGNESLCCKEVSAIPPDAFEGTFVPTHVTKPTKIINAPKRNTPSITNVEIFLFPFYFVHLIFISQNALHSIFSD